MKIPSKNESNRFFKKPSTNVKAKPTSFPVDTYLHNNYSLSAHDYEKHSNWVESEYSDDIIRHVAGSTVYSIKKKFIALYA